MITFDSLWEVAIALSNGTVADFLPFSHNTCVTYRRRTDIRRIIPKARPNGRPKAASI